MKEASDSKNSPPFKLVPFSQFTIKAFGLVLKKKDKSPGVNPYIEVFFSHLTPLFFLDC